MAEVVVFDVEVRDKTKQGLAKVNRSLGDTANRAGGLTGKIKGLSGAIGKAGLAGAAIAGAAAVGVKLVSSFLSANTEIARMSTSLGISTDDLQKWKFAAEQSGTELEVVGDASRTLSERIREAAEGSEDAISQFDALGLSAEELGKLTPNEQLRTYFGALGDVENQSVQTAIGQAALGDDYARLSPLIEGGSAALDEYGRQAEVAGILTEAQIRASERSQMAFGNFNNALKGVVNQGIAALLPAIEGLSKFLSETVAPFMTNTLIPVMQRLIEDGFKAIKQAVEDLQPVFEVVWEAISFAVDLAITQIKQFIASFRTVLNGVITFLDGVFSLNFTQVWEGLEQIFGGIIAGMLARVRPFIAVLAELPFVGGLFEEALNLIDGVIASFTNTTDDGEESVDALNTTVTAAVLPLQDMAYHMGVAGDAAADAKTDIDNLTLSNDALAQSTGRSARLIALQAQLATVGTGELGLDPGDISGLLTQINVAEAGLGLASTPIATVSGSGRTGRTGAGGTGDDTTPAARETPEQRFTRLLEEQQIRLLNQGISGGSLDLLLGLFEDQLGLDAAGLRSARIAGGGKTAFESSLANFLRQRAERASDKADRDREAVRAADKAAQDAAKLAADLLKEQNDKIDAQLKLQADLLREGFDSSTIVRLLRLFKEEVGLDDRALNSLRVVGGGRTAFEQALFDARNPAQEEETQMAKAVAKGVTMANEQAMRRHVCVPSELNAHETVLNLESPAQRGTTRRSLVLAEGLC